MRLKRFRVTNFRSVRDGGWLDVDDVTALIGVNESGNTNLLLPLWKLNPAHGGELQPNADYPKSLFQEVRNAPEAYRFVEAEFECEALGRRLTRLTGLPLDEARIVRVGRFFDGRYSVTFPKHVHETVVPTSDVARSIEEALAEVAQIQTLKSEVELQSKIVERVHKIRLDLDEQGDALSAEAIGAYMEQIEAVLPEKPAKTSLLVPRVGQLHEALSQRRDRLNAPYPGDHPEVVAAVRDAMPRFVYYSHYGNLDSEIYLPHVVDNLRRQEAGEDLGAKEAAKARTLRVLFRFVGLEPQEILELGREPHVTSGSATVQEIDQATESKKERINLLQGAHTKLTKKFREWWKQGDYRFRFVADGNHFRIYVADDRRPEEVELEGRSAGLQWFLSFYLVFLVEAEEGHSNTILLLDEPGLQLHPLAQHDLSAFLTFPLESGPLRAGIFRP